MKSRVLLVEDDETFFDALGLILADEPIEIVWAKTGAEGIQILRQNPFGFAVVIIDYRLPDATGSDICRHLKRVNREQVFLFASKYFEKEYLLDQLRTGSNGFIDKSAMPAEIKNEILRAVSTYENENRILGIDAYEKSQAERDLENEGFIGVSQAMHSILRKIKSARESRFSTLIVGETGVGKEITAKAIVPAGKNLISISCASFSNREHMLESELFGYVKGAFTDAKNDTPGLIMQAHNNVLFLDELHQLPIAAQAKLLRFLQEMKFRRVGDSGGREITVDFKLIAAVQPDIKQRLKDGRFLPDLLERIGALVIHVPALRDRPEDIEPLVRKFQGEFNAAKPTEKPKHFHISTISNMKKQAWPTNVRGLQNAVKRMLTNCTGVTVYPKDFRKFLADDLMSETRPIDDVNETLPLAEAKKVFETNTIISALKNSRTRVEAAARVGLPMTSFLRRLEKFQINAEIFLHQNQKGQAS